MPAEISKTERKKFMNSRERFLIAANGGRPDRIPVLGTLTPQAAVKVAEHFGITDDVEPVDSFLSTRLSHVALVNKLGNDAVIIGSCRESGKETRVLPDGTSTDEFGFIYTQCGLYGEVTGRPLANCESVEDVLAYELPNPNDEGRFALANAYFEKYHKDYAIVGDLEATIFELAWNLVGLEKFLVDMACEEEYVDVLLDKITDFNMAIALNLVDIGCDMIWLGDDVGMQIGPMIKLELYKKYLLPHMRKIFRAIKSKNPKVRIAYHSCGSVLPFIPSLIDAGMEVLNPIQPMANGMDLGLLKKQYGEKLVFFGGIDIQNVLPNGTPEDVENEVKLRIKQGGADGGFILAPAHNIQADTPVENILMMYEAIFTHGKY